jgi:DnaJ family protein C protein 27
MSSKSSSKASSSSKKAIPLPVPPTRIKLLSMGNGGVGKSCLIKRFCEERFVQKYIATIGVDYGVKPVKIEGLDVRVNFWDLSGHPEFLDIRNEFYKDAQAIILVYDVSSRDTFENLDFWLTEATKFGANIREVPVVVCANKVDKKRVISQDEGSDYARSRNLQYFETSASTGDNVNEMFNYVFGEAVRKITSAGGAL